MFERGLNSLLLLSPCMGSSRGDCLIMVVGEAQCTCFPVKKKGCVYICAQGRVLIITDSPWVFHVRINVMMMHLHKHSIIIFMSCIHTRTHAGSIKGSVPSVQSHSVSLARNNRTVITTVSLHDVFKVLAGAQP